MVASVGGFGEFSLAVNRASEFTAPDDQRIVQHAALLQVRQQRRRRLVHIAALIGQVFGKREMLVPAAMEDLREPHTAFRHPARQQTTVGERAWNGDVLAVHVQNVLRLVADIG